MCKFSILFSLSPPSIQFEVPVAPERDRDSDGDSSPDYNQSIVPIYDLEEYVHVPTSIQTQIFKKKNYFFTTYTQIFIRERFSEKIIIRHSLSKPSFYIFPPASKPFKKKITFSQQLTLLQGKIDNHSIIDTVY